jgi:hypothetical protein
MTKAAKKKTKPAPRAAPVEKTMTGEEFFDKITKLGFNQQSFGRTIGVHGRTVIGWSGGRYKGVPRYIAMLVNLMIETKSGAEDLRP